MNIDNLVYRDDVKRLWDELTSLEKSIINDVLLDINGDNLGKENVSLTYVIDEDDKSFNVYWYLEMVDNIQITKAFLSESMQTLIDYKTIALGRF